MSSALQQLSASRRSLRSVGWALGGLIVGLVVAADRWSLPTLVMAVTLGLVAGFVTGWAGRTSENAQWAEECRRLVAIAEEGEQIALAECERLAALPVAVPMQAAMPAINVHVHTGGEPYRDLAGATAAAVAARLPMVLEAGDPDGG
jgi:hypothetical protein